MYCFVHLYYLYRLVTAIPISLKLDAVSITLIVIDSFNESPKICIGFVIGKYKDGNGPPPPEPTTMPHSAANQHGSQPALHHPGGGFAEGAQYDPEPKH